MITYCEHDHLVGQCETCSMVRAMERGHEPARRPQAAPDPRVTVDQDTAIERADLGDGITTYVAAGDLVPLGLEDLPRAAAPARGGGVATGASPRRSRSGRQPAPPPQA